MMWFQFLRALVALAHQTQHSERQRTSSNLFGSFVVVLLVVKCAAVGKLNLKTTWESSTVCLGREYTLASRVSQPIQTIAFYL